ncbi:BppU family phage baseplate upper protein [Clostridium thermosuccinogenes]|uniref:BppU family phage baseplate upper protein n=1 Tax=Clostridium thermosuccinogenes TaxID=84032 RepID=UPI00137A69DB|nr:BppU family phage baseplate upper protein [Pseudoclostridium thermosuccinogenes]
MEYKIYRFNLDLKSPSYYAIQPKQGETGVKLIPTLVSDSLGYNLAGTIVNAIFRKPDNTVSYLPCAIEDAAKGIVSVVLTNQVLALPGKVDCEIQVTGDKGLVKSWTFSILVQQSVGTDEIESSNEFVALQAALETVNQYNNRIVNLEEKDVELEKKISEAQYSAPQETIASVISLPSSVAEGQFSDMQVIGNTRTNPIINTIEAFQVTFGSSTATVENGFMKFTGETIRQQQFAVVPNTQYTLGFVARKEGSGNCTYSIRDIENNAIVTDRNIDSASNQQYKITFNSGNNNAIKIRLYAGISTSLFIKEITINEGSELLHYINGTKSTESVRVRSIGKNLFNKDREIVKGWYLGADGKGYPEANSVWSRQYIPVKPSTNYKTNVTNINIVEYDLNKNFIKATILHGAVFTTSPNSYYVRLSRYGLGTDALDNVQFEEGSVATAYESYKDGGEAYIDEVGGRLPNGVFDEFNVTTGEKTQRVSDDFIINENTQFGLFTTSEQTVRIEISSLNPKATNGWYSPNILINNRNMPAVSGYTAYNTDSEGMGIDASGSYLYIRILKSRLSTVDIAGVKAWLASNSITVNYQLATPITHKGTSQSLIAYPKGHLIIECVKRVTKSYDNGIIVDTPIETIESVTKVEDGERIPIDLSKVTVAGNKLSFTITGATKNEVYEVIYHYNGVLPTVRFSYPQNVAAAIDGNTKGVAANSKAINDFISYQNAINLQFDLRLVALEP